MAEGPPPDAFVLRTAGPDDTRAAGEALGRCLRTHEFRGAVVALEGPLGAGKTCFVQGLARGLGATGCVRSPTFVLVREHPGPFPLHHVDLYRLGPADVDALGLEEIMEGEGVTAIEWPCPGRSGSHSGPGGGGPRPAGVLPADHLSVEFAFGTDDDARILRFSAHGERSRRILNGFAACVSSR